MTASAAHSLRKLNVPAAFGRIPEAWSPHVAARVNGQEVRLAKLDGAFDWHAHEGVDEAFMVIRGAFVMELRDEEGARAIEMTEGDLLVVPAGVEHRPVAARECWVLLIENAGTRNTGAVVTERTRDVLPEL